MMSGWKRKVVGGAIGALVLCVTVAEPALAAAGGQSAIGDALGKQIQDFGAAILFPVAGVAGLVAFGRRAFGAVVVVFGVSAALAGFLLVPDVLEAIIRQTWESVR
jgi:hypothetical protein